MKKYYLILGFLVVLTIIFIYFLNSRNNEIKNIDSQGKNLICFGNSLTAGYGVSPDNAYPALLQKNLSLPVINAGVSGDTTRDALNRLERDVLSKEPRLVIIEFGGNDFLEHIPKEETIKNIEEIVKRIQEAGAMVVLVEVRTGFLNDQYLEDYKRIAKKYKVLFIPNILKGILYNSDLTLDQIHPNEEGYKIMTERILKEIKKIGF
jgi:acyl-CoA thioesterase-1